MAGLSYQRSTFGILTVILACGVMALAFFHNRGAALERRLGNVGGEIAYENSAAWLAARFKADGHPDMAKGVDRIFGRIVSVDFGRTEDLKTTDPADVFAALAQAPDVRVVMFDGLPLTDQHLTRLADFTSIKQIGIKNAQATERGIEDLRKKRPDAEVVWLDKEQPQAQLPTQLR